MARERDRSKTFRIVFGHFLDKGFNVALLQSLRKSPEEMEVLHISATGFARIFAPSFKNLTNILSIPSAYEISIQCKISKTLFSIVRDDYYL